MSGATRSPGPEPCCPVCAGTDLAARYALGGGVVLAACPRCDVLVRREPPGSAPPPSWDHYDEHLGGYRADTGDHLRRVARRRLALVSAVAPGGRLLEVGPGSGEFLAAAREAGFTCEGLEPSGAMAGVARAGSGCPVHQLPFEEFHPAALYDWIVMWHVFEHLARPAAAVAALAGLLVPGGRLALIVPNRCGWLNRLLGARAPTFAQGDHLFLYSPPALAGIVSACFEVSLQRTYEPPENAFSTAYNLAGRVAPVFSRGRGGGGRPGPVAAPGARGALRRAVRRLPWTLSRLTAPITWPLRALAERCGGGHEIWLVARKLDAVAGRQQHHVATPQGGDSNDADGGRTSS